MLFADDPNNAATWIGVALGALALMGTIATAAIAYLTNRDKLQYDVKLALLEKSNQECKEAHKACEERSGEQDAKIESQDERISKLEQSKPLSPTNAKS